MANGEQIAFELKNIGLFKNAPILGGVIVNFFKNGHFRGRHGE